MAKLYWLTGYSGAGKTTVGKELYKILKEENNATVFLDGDEMRKVFGDDLGYTKEDRYKAAMRYAKLCNFLTSQGLDVVCCTVSMFNAVRDWNRENTKNYIEVYLKVPQEVLQERDQKGMYSGQQQGTTNNVVGVDLVMEEPQNPNIIIENDGSLTPQEAAKAIYEGESYCV